MSYTSFWERFTIYKLFLFRYVRRLHFDILRTDTSEV